MPQTSLSDVLTAGLRRSYRAGRNEKGLLELLNAHVNPHGLYPYEAVNHVTSITASTGIPAVQLFRGPTYILGFGNDNKIYKLTDGAASWTVAATLTTGVDPDNLSATINISSGQNIWHVAFFEKGWIACNGTQCVFSEDGSTTFVDDYTYPLSVCEFRGRVFYGGIARHFLRWNDQNFSTEFFGQTLPAFTDGWIAWCSIKGEDILQHVWPERAVSNASGRVETELLSNGNFSGGFTDWSASGVGWTQTVGPNRYVAVATTDYCAYAIDSSGFTATTYRFEIDLEVTSGSVVVAIDTDIGATAEYIGPTLLDASGNHVLYFYIDDPTKINGITIDGTTGDAFTGTVYGVSCKASYRNTEFASWDEQARLMQTGFSRSKDQGKVLCIKALRDHVVVYGENFITAYSPVSVPSPTFGRTFLTSFGVAGRGAVGGSIDKHLIMDVSGKLWSLNNELRLEEVGYQEFFENVVDNDESSPIVINYDQNEELFYITYSDATYTSGRTFLLSNQGMSEIGTEVVHSVCGVHYSGTYGETCGWVGGVSDDGFYLLTDDLDFGSSDLKIIERVRVVADNPTSFTVQVQVQVSTNGVYRFMEGEVANRDGDVYPCVSGRVFRLRLNASDAQSVRLYDLIVEWSTEGKHNMQSVSIRR